MIKAIETQYKGYKFRSRLEARWAVFFDAMGIEYQYEIEGFETPYGWYLPDFYLPEFNAWVEVKGGRDLTTEENNKLRYVCFSTSTYGMIFKGDPYEVQHNFKGDLLCSVFDEETDVERYIAEQCFIEFFVKDNKPGVICNAFGCQVYGDMYGFKYSEPDEILNYYVESDEQSGWGQPYALPGAIGGNPRYKTYACVLASDPQLIECRTTKKAALKARQARFEHGETPKTKQGNR